MKDGPKARAERTKDGPKARADLKSMGIRQELHANDVDDDDEVKQDTEIPRVTVRKFYSHEAGEKLFDLLLT